MEIKHYGVVIGVTGRSVISHHSKNLAASIDIDVEQAFLIPGTSNTLTLANDSKKNAVVLVALPNI